MEPVCSVLYQSADKCHQHLTAVEYNYTGNAANNEAKQWHQGQDEDAVCSFILALKSNTSDGNGEMPVAGGSDEATPPPSHKNALAEFRSMHSGMKIALIISVFAATAMAMVACVVVHRVRRGPVKSKS
jgi:hypothetical protein